MSLEAGTPVRGDRGSLLEEVTPPPNLQRQEEPGSGQDGVFLPFLWAPALLHWALEGHCHLLTKLFLPTLALHGSGCPLVSRLQEAFPTASKPLPRFSFAL